MPLSLGKQLLLALVLILATGAGIHNIAEARNEAAVGGGAIRLEASRLNEMTDFGRILGVTERLGRGELAERLREVQRKGGLWAAPHLGADHWALYVDTFGVVRRIYVRESALHSPESQLFPRGDASIPPEKRRAFANVSLVGALFHELQHWEGVEDEALAYEREIAWLEALQHSLPRQVGEGERDAIAWGVESALLSARKARALAAGQP
ncbi:MAG TPA: hypothetical protein VKA01_07155 [Vicinamibacteria bacterium]|nr:hypothetical protein [Vicinamibacteria bacterium]